MSEVETFDQASLETFTSGLVAAGFEPERGTDRRFWKGPIPAAFAGLTEATRMRVMIRDGWPFTSPVVLVDGLHSSHQTLGGYVCLWHDGDSSGGWLSTKGFFVRVDEWCNQAKSGWDRRGLARDAYLNFTNKYPAVVTYDLDALHVRGDGAWGSFHATVAAPWRVELGPGAAPAPALSGIWFHASHVDVPPRSLDELLTALSRAQRRGLERALANRRNVRPLERSGGADLVMFRWDTEAVRHLIVLGLSGSADTVDGHVLADGPTDETSLLLRSGPDAHPLRERSAVIFGVGTLGGHAAVCIASSGLGRLRIVDGDLILPGNVVRHVVGHSGVGVSKAPAVEVQIKNHAPWTEVDTVVDRPVNPSRLRALVDDVDLVIDATGTEAVTGALAMTAARAGKPLISGALYRGGAIARVRRQGTSGDVPFADRTEPTYRVIPPGASDDELVEPAVGCSAPANNAPPASALACAALIVQVSVDVLAGRCQLPDEVTDVYRPIEGEAPFDVLGRVR